MTGRLWPCLTWERGCVGGAEEGRAIADMGACVGRVCGAKARRKGACGADSVSLTLSPSSLQETADIALPVDLAAMRTATADALKGLAVGRTPEVFVELRAKTVAASAWCEKVRWWKGRT